MRHDTGELTQYIDWPIRTDLAGSGASGD